MLISETLLKDKVLEIIKDIFQLSLENDYIATIKNSFKNRTGYLTSSFFYCNIKLFTSD